MSNTPNGEYHCVESVEGAGIVYGEIVHSTLYECIKNMYISVEGCVIYDYEKNTWESDLSVGKIASGSERVWHLKECNDLVSVKCAFSSYSVSDNTWQSNNLTCTTILEPEVGSLDLECQKYYLRQQVLELLAESREYTENMHSFVRRNTPPPAPRIRRQMGNHLSSSIDYQNTSVPLFEPPPRLSPLSFASDNVTDSEEPCPTAGEVLRKKLLDKMNEIKSYINQLGDETGMLGALCDDLYVCTLALKSNRGLTYILARQTSQGNQRAYNAVGIDDLTDDTQTGHQMSSNMVSPYASQQVGNVIRGVSAPLPSQPM